MNTENAIECPLCHDQVEKLLYRFHINSEQQVINRIKQHNPNWAENDGICGRCVDYYHTEIVREQRILPEVGPYFPIKSADDFIILPTNLRLDADPRYTGKGVTICFIDSGFYPHPDLVQLRNRVKAYVDVCDPSADVSSWMASKQVSADKWHGTMTTVVGAGDGYLSGGLYRGIASNADLVLIKVQDETGRIRTENIVKALLWVVENHAYYGIRIVNMSLGDEKDCSYKESDIDLLAETLIEQGINIVAAVGNDEHADIKPPANAPHVIAVGGIDDNNQLDNSWRPYHSTFGTTRDALTKPELVAHAIWVAAPILPGTVEQKEAVTLYSLVHTPDTELRQQLIQSIHTTKLEASVTNESSIQIIRAAILQRIQQCKYIAPHYMHVDGTSFAAPIVSSVIAQLLEENPELTPAAIRQVLFSTAQRMEGVAVQQQGFGAVQPRKAILKILKRSFIMKPQESPSVNKSKHSIEFYIQNDCAHQISLAGDFNHWAQDVLLMQPGQNGVWKIEIPLLPAGKYHYKFFVDDKMWMEDISNPYREPDGFSGFNSILVIEN